MNTIIGDGIPGGGWGMGGGRVGESHYSGKKNITDNKPLSFYIKNIVILIRAWRVL